MRRRQLRARRLRRAPPTFGATSTLGEQGLVEVDPDVAAVFQEVAVGTSVPQHALEALALWGSSCGCADLLDRPVAQLRLKPASARKALDLLGIDLSDCHSVYGLLALVNAAVLR